MLKRMIALTAAVPLLFWPVDFAPAMGQQVGGISQRDDSFVSRVIGTTEALLERNPTSEFSDGFRRAIASARAHTAFISQIRDVQCSRQAAGLSFRQATSELQTRIVNGEAVGGYQLHASDTRLWIIYAVVSEGILELDPNLCVVPQEPVATVPPATTVTPNSPAVQKKQTKCYNKKTTAIETISRKKCPKGWKRI